MKLFFSPAYALGGPAFDTTRKSEWIAESLARDPTRNVQVVAPPLLDPTSSQSSSCTLWHEVHEQKYIQAIQTGEPRALAESSSLSWDPQVWNRVLASNSGVVAAALEALEHGVAGSLSSGLHHARAGSGDGYCTFNGLVLAAVAALRVKDVRRILIIDADAHCGGGTEELIAPYGRLIHHVDISVDPYDRYVPVPPHKLDLVERADTYIKTFVHRFLDNLLPTDFDLCLYNAGMDPYEGCAEGGCPGITAEVLATREKLVFAWCRTFRIPIAFVIAGGYVGDRLTRDMLVRLHRLTIETAAEGPSF